MTSRARIALLAVSVALASAGCQASVGTPVATPDPFSGLPYTVSIPPGWIAGTAATFAEQIAEFTRENPDLAAKARELSPPVENEFIVTDPSSSFAISRSCSINTGAVDGMWSESEALDEMERQNVEGIAELPTTAGRPVADRVHLPAGNAVRIRWTSAVIVAGKSERETSIGHTLVAAGTQFTMVCLASEADRQAGDAFEAIAQSLRTR
jgi:hypothetical protein